jgi:hypothetical protein
MSFILTNMSKSPTEINSELSQTFSCIEYVSVKLAMRPIKFYKLVQCEKSKIHEYNYIIEKIKSNVQTNINYSTDNMSYVIYLKSNSKDEIQISDEKEWKLFFEESGRSIFELIDSKNTLKIEYKCKPVTNTIIEKNILLENEKFGIELLKSVFNLSLRNETSKIRIKDDLINSEILTSSNINLKNDINNFINSQNFESHVQKFFEKTCEKLEKLSNLKINIINDETQNNSEILFEEGGNLIDIPAFSEFYKDEQIEGFRSKILSETFMESKK